MDHGRRHERGAGRAQIAAAARVVAARLARCYAPVSLTYEVTHRCNLACRYCDRHRAMAHEMNALQIFDVLAQFVKNGTRYVSLDGGEALLHPNIFEIVEFLVGSGVEVGLNSNGILIPKRLDTVRLVSKVKISLDGPARCHDAMRGAGAFEKALAGARAARQLGTPVEFTCTLGQHNAHAVDQLLDLVANLDAEVIVQPATNSLFLDSDRDGSDWVLENEALHRALARVEERKTSGAPVANGWASLRHFRTFPNDTPIPCSAGKVSANLDPEGVLIACDQLSRGDRDNNVLTRGVKGAFKNLDRSGCQQCWCARIVESNMLWGLRLNRTLAPRRPRPATARGPVCHEGK